MLTARVVLGEMIFVFDEMLKKSNARQRRTGTDAFWDFLALQFAISQRSLEKVLLSLIEWQPSSSSCQYTTTGHLIASLT